MHASHRSRTTSLLIILSLSLSLAACDVLLKDSPDGSTSSPGGAGGAAGTSAPGGGGGSGGSRATGTGCGAEASPNEDRAHAEAYTLGKPSGACLQSPDDVDFYQFTVPATPAQGGYVQVQITDVGEGANLEMVAYAGHDSGEFATTKNGGSGGSLFMWFAAQPGATFQLKVAKNYAFEKPAPYTLTALFNAVNDVNEPNDDNAHATALPLGQTAKGYFFAGRLDSTAPMRAAWSDRFKVTLPVGMVTISVTDVAPDINAHVALYDPAGTLVVDHHEANDGSSVVLEHALTAKEAGDCYIEVLPYYDRASALAGEGSTVPAFFRQPYTLKVTAP